MKKNLLFVLVVCLAGCTTFGGRREKLSAESPSEFLSGNTLPTVKTSVIRDSLYRAGEHEYSRGYKVYVEAIPQTSPLLRAESFQTISEQAWKEKWANEKRTRLLTKADELLKNRNLKCFILKVTTDDPRASNSKEWHAVLTQDQNKVPVKLEAFEGFEQKSTHIYTSKYGGGAYNTYKYFQVTTACAEKSIDPTKKFTLMIDPRYIPGIPEFYLTWVPAKEVAKGK